MAGRGTAAATSPSPSCCDEARAPAVAAAEIDRAIGLHATRAEAERHVAALVGSTVRAASLGYDDALVLQLGTDVLRTATWLLSADDEPVARAGDEDALEQLWRLEGRSLTTAGLRRNDAALVLSFDDDPYGACLELSVRGRRRTPIRWELATAGGLLVAADGHGALTVGHG